MNNIWDMWIQAASSKESPYMEATRHMQQAISAFWQIPADYWQAASAIYAARARTWQGLMDEFPRQVSVMAQCRTFPELVETATRVYGHNVSCLMTLTATIQSHRMNLLKAWQADTEQMLPLALRAASTTAMGNTWLKAMNTVTTNNPMFKIPDMMQGTASPMTAGLDFQKNIMQTFMKGWPMAGMPPLQQPMAQPQTNGVERQSAKETKASPARKNKDDGDSKAEPAPAVAVTKEALPEAPKPAVQAPAKETTAPAKASARGNTNQLALLTPPNPDDVHHTPGMTGAPHHSSTASNGVVRSSGALVATAAAAAARRSVVARRASRTRARIVRPAR